MHLEARAVEWKEAETEGLKRFPSIYGAKRRS
jgi:hypothetical protein